LASCGLPQSPCGCAASFRKKARLQRDENVT
jgi:hypothetical protein